MTSSQPPQPPLGGPHPEHGQQPPPGYGQQPPPGYAPAAARRPASRLRPAARPPRLRAAAPARIRAAAAAGLRTPAWLRAAPAAATGSARSVSRRQPARGVSFDAKKLTMASYVIAGRHPALPHPQLLPLVQLRPGLLRVQPQRLGRRAT